MGSPPPYAGCCAKAGCTAARAAVAPHTWQVARPSATLDPQVEQYMGTLPAAARAACRFSGRTGRPGRRVPGRDLIRSNFEKDSPADTALGPAWAGLHGLHGLGEVFERGVEIVGHVDQSPRAAELAWPLRPGDGDDLRQWLAAVGKVDRAFAHPCPPVPSASKLGLKLTKWKGNRQFHRPATCLRRGYGLGALGVSRRWTRSMPIRMPARIPAAIAAISLDLALQGFRGTWSRPRRPPWWCGVDAARALCEPRAADVATRPPPAQARVFPSPGQERDRLTKRRGDSGRSGARLSASPCLCVRLPIVGVRNHSRHAGV